MTQCGGAGLNFGRTDPGRDVGWDGGVPRDQAVMPHPPLVMAHVREYGLAGPTLWLSRGTDLWLDGLRAVEMGCA
ncbi:hypothetical protein GCM10009818_32160 [Nakamurella flavida]